MYERVPLYCVQKKKKKTMGRSALTTEDPTNGGVPFAEYCSSRFWQYTQRF